MSCLVGWRLGGTNLTLCVFDYTYIALTRARTREWWQAGITMANSSTRTF